MEGVSLVFWRLWFLVLAWFLDVTTATFSPTSVNYEAFAGDSDMGLRYILEGCPRLEKLEIRDSPFGVVGLRSGMHRYQDMRFVWMSSCRLSRGSCRDLTRALPNVVVEVFGSDDDDDDDNDVNEDYVETLYMYGPLMAQGSMLQSL